MENILINQGSFQVPTTGIITQYIPVRSGFDWVKVWNYDGWAAGTANTGIEFFWQKGMPLGSALAKWVNGSAAINAGILTSGGISFADSSITTPEAPLAGTTIARASNVATTTPVNGYAVGDIVRLYSITGGVSQIAGIDFTVSAVGANTFTIGNLSLSATDNPTFTSDGSAFVVRRIPWNPYYYPRNRTIVNFQAATVAGSIGQWLITLSVTHGYTVNQMVRINIPSIYGVTCTNMQGVITAIGQTDTRTAITSTNTITVAFPASANPVGSSVFVTGTFIWPAIGVPLQLAEVTPIGDFSDSTYVTGTSPTSVYGIPLQYYLALDATRNDAALYLVLGTGGATNSGGAYTATITGPAGEAANSTIYWQAGKNYLI